MNGNEHSMAASPYATGGGGTVLEHRYGAVLLTHLLTGDPVSVLGDDAVPVSVRFQASSFSPVDDLLVVGRTPDDRRRQVSIGVRRAPVLVSSDGASVRLLASYLRVVTDHWQEVQTGRWRLGLAVASRNAAVQQVGELSVIARATPDTATFRAEMERPQRTNERVRRRLGHVDALVGAAATEAGVRSDVGTEELTWRLLSALYVAETRLEGADETDRTMSVTRLRTATRDETVVAADALFSRLAELVSRYAPAGSEVTELLLRRDLSGTPLKRSPSYARAWQTLDGLAARLRDRTGFRLADSTADLELARAEPREALIADMVATAKGPAALVVLGEPDVGKSALTLRATEQLGDAGVAVTSVSLRDLPAITTDLEAVLGGGLVDVLGGAATGSGRLLVVDGAESVLEGRGPLLTDVATAALRAGLGVVTVTRRDGARKVAEALQRAGTAAGSESLREHEVLSLTAAETEKVAATFSSLTRLVGEPRTAWLLGRPGLVDLLLRAGAAPDLPGGPLSEAEVFACIWHHLVRCGEVSVPGGPSPDTRERALTSLARRLLLPGEAYEPHDAEALPSLRSDGLLLPPGPTSAWNLTDEFASDLARDLSLARLLITEGWGILDRAEAPRWSLRAVRLACQATLLTAASDSEDARAQLQATFDDLAVRHGVRWAEVPLEAILTLGSAREFLARAWPALLDSSRSGLRTLLRIALQRYTEQGFGDQVVLAPLVELTFCDNEDLGQHHRYTRHDTGAQIRELVLVWLRGLVNSSTGSLPLRQEARDRLLAMEPEPYDEFAIEALAMLGPDLDERAEAFIQRVGRDHPGRLAPVVELIGPIGAMSAHQPELLITLTEAFYVEHPNDDRYHWSSSPLDTGIRGHQKTLRGFSVPMGAWYFGPFFRLLNTRPVETIEMINRMLDHAAAVRVDRLRSLDDESPDADSAPWGLDLDLPGAGRQRCVGDAHVWSWYRGSTVGPYPCMSALLAVERFADHLVDALGLPLKFVTRFLLQGCHNLAMPGLVVGLLVRHLDRAGDLLDRWLVRPELWNLEFSRRASEGVLHVQGPDAPDIAGRDQRRYTFRDVAVQMTLGAMISGDDARLTALDAIADELVRRAREQVTGDNDEELATVEGWAALFRPQNYRTREADDGRVIIQYEHPEGVASALAPTLASLARGNEGARLQLTYASSEDRVASVETLIEDLAIARDLAQHPPTDGPVRPIDPVAAVAVAAVVARAQGRASVPDDDLLWAAELLIAVAVQPQTDQMSFESSTYPMAADRSAAVGLPTLLLPAFDGVELDRSKIEEALRHCTTSLFDEVRAAFVVGVRPVWEAPCETHSGTGACRRHETAWTAIQDGLRDCRLGDWNPTAQQRLQEPLDGPYEQTLPVVNTESLLVNRLTHPLVAAADVARSESCVASSARQLLGVLFKTYSRGLDHWAREGYGDFQNRQRPRVARVLVEMAAASDTDPLTDYIRLFTSNARALHELLHDLAVLFTYDEVLRLAMSTVWRGLMTTAMDALDAGGELLTDRHWSDYAVASLIPTPQLDLSDRDPDATLKMARQSWMAADELSDLVARWTPIAQHKPSAIDAVIQLAQCSDPIWQAVTGLRWVEELVDNDYDAISARCWFLTEWLEAVRTSGQLDAEGLTRWRRIVDGLAASGDSRAVRLQQAEE